MEELKTKLQDQLNKFKNLEKEYNKLLSQRTTLDGQLHENTNVQKELELCKQDNEVYKLIGPVLVKQELSEARTNVEKRISYIKAELKRIDDLIVTLEQKQEGSKEMISKLQLQFEQEQMKMMPKA